MGFNGNGAVSYARTGITKYKYLGCILQEISLNLRD